LRWNAIWDARPGSSGHPSLPARRSTTAPVPVDANDLVSARGRLRSRKEATAAAWMEHLGTSAGGRLSVQTDPGDGRCAPRWVGFALERRGLERRWIDDTQAAIERFKARPFEEPDEFLRDRPVPGGGDALGSGTVRRRGQTVTISRTGRSCGPDSNPTTRRRSSASATR